jgi:hypothetical protein
MELNGISFEYAAAMYPGDAAVAANDPKIIPSLVLP